MFTVTMDIVVLCSLLVWILGFCVFHAGCGHWDLACCVVSVCMRVLFLLLLNVSIDVLCSLLVWILVFCLECWCWYCV